MVEALIVIGNEAHLLKAVENPYMMKDRPIVVYRPEIITGRFFGCGTVEKGYNMQKALDGQMRAHMDATALATAPMMGMDATRMPRLIPLAFKLPNCLKGIFNRLLGLLIVLAYPNK